MISLGIVSILKLLHFTVNPVLPSTFAAIVAAIYSEKLKKNSNRN